jgi:glutamate--cysteine ligase
MSLDRAQPEAQPVTGTEQLVAFFREAERPVAQHQVGLEHEKFVYPVGSAVPVSYEGASGIGALLGRLVTKGYQPFRDSPDQPIIALTRGRSTVSLEPGGQVELSGTPAKTAREVHAENLRHISEVKEACTALGLRLVALGYRPVGTVAEMPWMPKRRYEAMRETLGRRGRLALDMMLMTATGQVSYDWSDEADCVRKVVAVARLAPLMVALCANSPLVRGMPSGFMSYRSHVWSDVDLARCGYLRSMFDGSFSYRAYVEWALDAPLLFLRREGNYLKPELTFRQLLSHGYNGEPALYSDWVDHLSALFPEVRIKKVIEVRGADCVPPESTGALAALWRGVLYDRAALEEAENLIPRLSFEQHLEFHALAQRHGLSAQLRKHEFSRLAQELVAIAGHGLARLDPKDAELLEPLARVAVSGKSPAHLVLDEWKRTNDPVKLLDRFQL